MAQTYSLLVKLVDPLAVPDHKIRQCIERSAFFQLRQMECLKVPREAPERRGG